MQTMNQTPHVVIVRTCDIPCAGQSPTRTHSALLLRSAAYACNYSIRNKKRRNVRLISLHQM
jgi:hypothetical protein